MTTAVAADQLRQFIERIERLEEEKAATTADIGEVYTEAKAQGFDAKIMRQIVKLRKLETSERQAQEATLDLYKAALGMKSYDDTPLGQAAAEKPSRADDEAATPPTRSPEPSPDPHPGVNIPAARAMGRKAARDSRPVTANPFPAGDPRRDAWDEAWCAESGEDGMAIPKDLRRGGDPKPGGDDDDGNGGCGSDG